MQKSGGHKAHRTGPFASMTPSYRLARFRRFKGLSLTMPIWRRVGTFLLSALLSFCMLANPMASAQVCVTRDDISLVMAIDTSSSMEAVEDRLRRIDLARGFAVGLLDALPSATRDFEGSAFYFCKGTIAGSGWLSARALRDRISSSLTSTCRGTAADGSYVYDAINNGIDLLLTRPPSDLRLLVVLSDGADSGSLGVDPSITLPASGIRAELIYAGSGGNPFLGFESDLVRARQTTFGDLEELAIDVARSACRNHQPTARLSVSPGSVVFGEGSNSFRFNASDSFDIEDERALSYSFRLTRPGGRPGPALPGGPVVEWTPSGLTAADFAGGSWTVTVTVTDGTGQTDTARRSFDILPGPPVVDLTAPPFVDAGETITIRQGITSDLDGGPLTYNWSVVTAPTSGNVSAVTSATGPVVTIDTTASDITHFSQRGDAVIDVPWVIELTLTDDEGDSASGRVTFGVANQVPEAVIDGAEAVYPLADPFGLPLSPRLSLTATGGEDPDGGPVVRRWDVIQSPISAFGGLLPATGWRSAEMIDEALTELEAGSWVMRLVLRDDEEESVETEIQFLVDAPPVVSFAEAPDTINEVLDELVLDGSSAYDPDTTCADGSVDCFVNIEGEFVSSDGGGIVAYRWYVADVARLDDEYHLTGRVGSVLEVSDTGPTLTIPPNTLAPGEWTFQLEVEDGEGNVATADHEVTVVPFDTAPYAQAGPPQRYFLDLFTGGSPTPVRVDGGNSFDPDDLGDSGSLPGIDSYLWEALAGGLTCAPSGTDAIREYFAAGAIIPSACFGHSLLQLTVGDNDSPQRFDTALTSLSIGTCPDLVCLDWPTSTSQARVTFVEDTDITIFYHVDPTITLGLPGGYIAQLNIYHDSDATTPVYTTHAPNVSTIPVSPLLALNWKGYWGTDRPKPGRYDVEIVLLDAAETPLGDDFAVRENDAILLEVEELDIDPDAPHYFPLRSLRDGLATLSVPFTLSGTAPPDHVDWELQDRATGALIYSARLPGSGSGDISWNGRLGAGSSAALVPPGEYVLVYNAMKDGLSLTGPVEHEITIFDLHVESRAGREEFAVLVNNDDDDVNGEVDLTQTTPIADENDIRQLTVIFTPSFAAEIDIASEASGASFDFRLSSDGTGRVTLPALLTVPEMGPIPNLYYQARVAGEAQLNYTLTPADGDPVDAGSQTIRQVEISLRAPNGTVRHHVDIADLRDAYDTANPPELLDTSSNPFVDREPDRFAVSVNDPMGNENDASAERAEARLEVLESIIGVDDLTTVPLRESATATDSGIFTSLTQILTPMDVPVDPDDDVRTHDGTTLPRDDSRGDRSHRANIDSVVIIEYEPFPGNVLRHKTPVCDRGPDGRFSIQVKSYIFKDPTTGVPLADDTYVRREISRANNAWGPACIEFRHFAPSQILDAPSVIPSGGTESANILGDGHYHNKWPLDTGGNCSHTDCAALISALPTLENDTGFVNLAVVNHIPGAFALAYIPKREISGVGISNLVVMRNSLSGRDSRILAHEIGHVMGNLSDANNPTYIFFPQKPAPSGAAVSLDYHPHDDRFDTFRRATQNAIDAIRTDRSQFHCSGGVCGDVSFPISDPLSLGNYALQPY